MVSPPYRQAVSVARRTRAGQNSMKSMVVMLLVRFSPNVNSRSSAERHFGIAMGSKFLSSSDDPEPGRLAAAAATLAEFLIPCLSATFFRSTSSIVVVLLSLWDGSVPFLAS